MFQPAPREYPAFDVTQYSSPFFLPALPVARHLRVLSDTAVDYLNQDGTNAASALDDITRIPGVSNRAALADAYLRSEFVVISNRKGHHLKEPLRELIDLIDRNYDNPAYDPEFDSFNANARPDDSLIKPHEAEAAFEAINGWPWKHADLANAARTVVLGAALYAARQLAEQLAEPEAPFRQSELPETLQQKFDVRINSALALSRTIRAHNPGAADALDAIIDMQIGNRVEALGSSMGSRTHWSKAHRSEIVDSLLNSAKLAVNNSTRPDIETILSRAVFVAARRLADSSLPLSGRPHDNGNLTQLAKAYSVLSDAPVPELQTMMRSALDTYALWHTKIRYDQLPPGTALGSELKQQLDEITRIVGQDPRIDAVITRVARDPSVDTLIKPIVMQIEQRSLTHDAVGL